MGQKITLPYNWKPRAYQMPCWQYFQGNAEGKRGCEVWHRRAGKDLFAINMIATKIPERVGTYWHLLPTYKQGRAIVWNGFTRDGRAFLDHFPPAMVTNKNSTEMRLTFYNGANYQVVGTDNVNSLVGTNPIGCVFSEYSLHDPAAWEYIRPILLENGGWALFIFTARGRNHGYKLLELAKKNPRWHTEVLVAGDSGTRREDGSPVFSDAMIDEERATGMPEEMVQQEYFCSFDAPFVGSYYGPQMLMAEKTRRLPARILHEMRLPVQTAWDLGVQDTTSIWFVQEFLGETRVIDYYSNSGEGLAHYAKLLRGQVAGHEHMGDYLYGTHHAPHDIKVKELGTGKSRFEVARELGIRFKVVKKHTVEDGIEAVRNLIPTCWFDATRCERGIESLRQYRKAWDEANKCFKSHPLHDWTSNGADAFRYYAVGRKDVDRARDARRQDHAVDEYAYI